MNSKTEKMFYVVCATILVFISTVQLYIHNIEKSFTLLVIVLLILRVITLLKDEK